MADSVDTSPPSNAVTQAFLNAAVVSFGMAGPLLPVQTRILKMQTGSAMHINMRDPKLYTSIAGNFTARMTQMVPNYLARDTNNNGEASSPLYKAVYAAVASSIPANICDSVATSLQSSSRTNLMETMRTQGAGLIYRGILATLGREAIVCTATHSIRPNLQALTTTDNPIVQDGLIPVSVGFLAGVSSNFAELVRANIHNPDTTHTSVSSVIKELASRSNGSANKLVADLFKGSVYRGLYMAALFGLINASEAAVKKYCET